MWELFSQKSTKQLGTENVSGQVTTNCMSCTAVHHGYAGVEHNRIFWIYNISFNVILKRYQPWGKRWVNHFATVQYSGYKQRCYRDFLQLK